MTPSRRLTLAFAVVVLASCHATPARPPATQPRTVSTEPRHTHENLNAVLWMQTGAEYKAATQQAYRLARVQLDAALADPAWTAAVEQSTTSSALPAAIVVDLDETVLDNSGFQARLVADSTPYRAISYTEDAWNRWCEERKAGAIPGAVEFLKYARSRGVTPIYITNRDHAVEDATRDVLARLGVPVETSGDTVLTRHENGWDASDKSERRRFVAASFRILLVIGDNFEDFVAGTRTSIADRTALAQKYADYWGTKWIVLPNPTYGSWETAITFGETLPEDPQSRDARILELKNRRLDLKR
jgi:5'-nucleotidase (lipoprotein e(P4) family)